MFYITPETKKRNPLSVAAMAVAPAGPTVTKGRKTPFPGGAGNGLPRSGKESLLRGPGCPKGLNLKNGRQVTFAMSRITKLTRAVGLTLDSERLHPGNDSFGKWTSTRMLGGSRTVFTRHGNQPTGVTAGPGGAQRSKANNGGAHGTTRYPNLGNRHGYGSSIVGGGIIFKSEYSGRRELGHRLYSARSTISPSHEVRGGCGSLLRLRQLNRENPKMMNKGIIHVISDVTTLILAYEHIKSKPGNMTPGVNLETLDGIDMNWILETSKLLKSGKFDFKPARRTYIPKPGSAKLKERRPLGIAGPREKVVQKAMQMVLEAIFEPSFLQCSHGFRPSRGNHTALKQIRTQFHGATWIIEADISKCFDTVDHGVLINKIRERIGCDKTLALIKKALRAGYIDLGEFVQNKTGTPQGSVLSPLLCNIYMHSLDEFVMTLKLNFDKGTQRRKNPLYRKLQYEISKKENSGDGKKKAIRRRMWALDSKDPTDPHFRRLFYVRYADDFILGMSGPRDEADRIKKEISDYLRNTLKLELNEDKTSITHFHREKAFFLGTFLSGTRRKIKPVRRTVDQGTGKTLKVRITPRVSMHAPIERLMSKAATQGLLVQKGNSFKATALRRLVNMAHSDILAYYNAVIRGIMNYYSFADNRKSLGSLIHGLKHSCALTLALKFKLRQRSKVFKRFGRTLKCPNTGAELKLPATFARKPEKQKFLVNPPLGEKALALRWSKKLTESNLGRTCLICGAQPAEMHHVRKIRDLKKGYRDGRLDFWTMQMAAINRKQIPLCKEHHSKLHKGDLSPQETEGLLSELKKFK